MRPALPWSPPKQGCSLACFIAIIGQPLAIVRSFHAKQRSRISPEAPSLGPEHRNPGPDYVVTGLRCLAIVGTTLYRMVGAAGF
jgi:hypothetical protein